MNRIHMRTWSGPQTPQVTRVALLSAVPSLNISNSDLFSGVFLGGLGGSVVERLPSAQVMTPGSRDRVLHWAPAGSLLLPLPLSLPLSLCLS